jgi:hypothetical protein
VMFLSSATALSTASPRPPEWNKSNYAKNYSLTLFISVT